MNLNPQLMAHFVAGAPGFLTTNTNPLRGLANGTSCIMYAIQWNNDDIRDQALQFLASNQGDVVLPDGLKPSNILIQPILRGDIHDQWPADLTCVLNEIVIPVEFKKEKDTVRSGMRSIPVVIEKPQFDLGFISTVHKAQGATLDRVIASFLDRPCIPS
jgi:hypothetical protein